MKKTRKKVVKVTPEKTSRSLLSQCIDTTAERNVDAIDTISSMLFDCLNNVQTRPESAVRKSASQLWVLQQALKKEIEELKIVFYGEEEARKMSEEE